MKLGKIELRVLSPVDIVVTKLGRLDDRDLADIEECIKRFKLQRRAICQRAERVQYVGNDSIFQYNLKTVLDRFFKKRPNKPARGAIS